MAQRVSALRCDEAAAKVDASAASVGRSGGGQERRKRSAHEERRTWVPPVRGPQESSAGTDGSDFVGGRRV
jgi:hypothetical protein